MNELLKVILSLSLSGSLLILLLLLCRPLLRPRTSKRWQYYIWLVVIARLLLPFTPEASPVGTLFQSRTPALPQASPVALWEGAHTSPPAAAAAPPRAGETAPPEPHSTPNLWTAWTEHLWRVWLAGALILLLRKVLLYQRFLCRVRAGREEISDVELLNRLAQTGAQAGVTRPVELYVNPRISSPLLLGLFRPCIVLPAAGLPEAEFQYTVHHELVHLRRRDMLYKWLVQLTVCLHWFNPLVWRMAREIDRACELSCDEAVIRTLDAAGRQAYGDTLLHAMQAGGGWSGPHPSLTLTENGALLKERLGAIMHFKPGSKRTAVLSLALAGALAVGAAAAGAYPGPVKTDTEAKSVPGAQKAGDRSLAAQAERFYEAGSLPLFQSVFSLLDGTAQQDWLEQIYEDGKIAFFSAALNEADTDSPLPASLAERAYADGRISFFSVLTDYMDDEALEDWLARALADGRIPFQSVLLGALNREEELDALEAELDRQQAEEYRAWGITADGNRWYYRGQLLRVFLDPRPNGRYVLNMNPLGPVSIKVIRGEDGSIQGIDSLTEAEITELFGDQWDWDNRKKQLASRDSGIGDVWNDWDGWDNWDGCDNWDGWSSDETFRLAVEAARVERGAFIWLGTCRLDEGDRVCYDVSAETGQQLDVGFARPGQTHPEVVYCTVSNRRTDGSLTVRTGAMPWQPEAGDYSLFIHAGDDALTGVEGLVTILKADPPA